MTFPENFIFPGFTGFLDPVGTGTLNRAIQKFDPEYPIQMDEVKVQDHIVGSTSYQLMSWSHPFCSM